MPTVDRVLPWRRHTPGAPEAIVPLLTAYRARHPKAPVTLITKAYEVAAEAHEHQRRK
jgi:GTP diphosphokinase / guanosine-3',5'-bis(diphosphate) 3'-diphosphatase